MLIGTHGNCPFCDKRAYLSRIDDTDDFECRSCGELMAEGAWHYAPVLNDKAAPEFFRTLHMSLDRSNNYHSERRVLGLPQGHPDLMATSEKDAMRICEKNGIDYHTQQFLTSEAKEAAVAKARAGNVKSGKIKRSQPGLRRA